ncbi:hypothetical protein, partial [Halorhodospira neutriphila]
PLIGALVGGGAGGPAGGAAAGWLFSRLFGRGFDEAAGIEYRVTGPWLDPQVERLPFDGLRRPPREGRKR